MKLLTDEIKAILPALYRTEQIPLEHKELIVKFFNPMGNQTWPGFGRNSHLGGGRSRLTPWDTTTYNRYFFYLVLATPPPLWYNVSC